MSDFDLITIGGGSGGVRASREAARLGAKVLLIEAEALGGTCVNAGCVPKKLLSYAAYYRYDFEDARGFGWEAELPPFRWAELIRAKDSEVLRLNRAYERLLIDAGVTIQRSRARLVEAHAVELEDGRRFRGRFILLATGSEPERLSVPGIEQAITSEAVFRLSELPQSILIVGGGYIALELASILRGLGSRVTVVHRGQAFLRGFDDELRGVLADELQKKGIDIRFGTELASVEKLGSGRRAVLSDGSVLQVSEVLVAVGRRARTAGLGLEAQGVQLGQRGEVLVNELFETSSKGVYAVGDVIDRAQLTPVAIREASIVANALFGGAVPPLDYDKVPTAVFTCPPVGAVGLTEERARARGQPVEVYVTRFRPLRHTLSGSDERTFMKLVVDAGSGRVLGFHMVGADAPEITQGVAIALGAGATKADLDATIGIHPTAAEEIVTLRTKRPG